eukprot:scaffold416_cov329-Pavlova_lutheri.AAC.39
MAGFGADKAMAMAAPTRFTRSRRIHGAPGRCTWTCRTVTYASVGKWRTGEKARRRQNAGRRSRDLSRLVASQVDRRGTRRSVEAGAEEANGGGGCRRVVVTGMGVVSSLGHEPQEAFQALLEGKSGVREIVGFDASLMSTRIAGEVAEFTAEGYLPKKMERRIDKTIKYTIVAGKKALRDAMLPERKPEVEDEEKDRFKVDRSRCGVLVGSAMGGMKSFADAVEALAEHGHRKMNPFCIPFAITNMGGAMLAMETGFMGPNYSLSTACATGNYCMLNAMAHIQNGEADVMLAGGAEAAVIPSGIAGFIACKALSKRNSAPGEASRPWDKGRDGFVMGEGGAVLVLEELEHARKRGAKIYAELLGGAINCDAHHMTEPQPEGMGVEACLRAGLKNACIDAGQVDYVNAHATSTPAGDMAEYRALRRVFSGDQVRINSTKSMIGHLLGAAGAMEAMVAVKTIETGWIHPNINLEDPEEEIDLRIVPLMKEQRDVRVALSNSFGFGGHNSCVIFAKYND